MQKVSLSLSGNSCTISNGILTMLWKEDGTLGSLVRNGVELVRDMPDRSEMNGRSVFYVDYHAEGVFRRFRAPRLKVVKADEQMAHVAYVDASGYLAIEFHIILMQGESGFYSYVIGANNIDVPFELSEFRIVCRFSNRIFDHAYNSERHGLQPTHKYMEQYEKLQDETYRMPDGEKYSNSDVYSKYDYAGHFSRNPVWGQYGHGYGFFLITASTEYYPGGPLKQELLVHYDGIVLNYFTGSHFGTGNLHVPMDWEKIYGPFYYYINEAQEPEELIQDALRVAEQEKAKWPYQWVEERLYPLERSTVSGRLQDFQGEPVSNAEIILGQGELPVELQSEGYLFYTNTDSQGRFVLKNVRPGTYSLFAYQTGGSDTSQLQLDHICITEREQDLGTIAWHQNSERVLWQLGKATRTCEGYRYAGELRNYKWTGLVPETLHFYLGRSREEEDWYYAQTKTGSWYVHFSLEQVPASTCFLIIALAGASRGGTESRLLPILTVALNGKELERRVFSSDNAIYRSTTTNGRYRHLRIPVDPSILHEGENVVQLSVEDGMVMYDTILLTEQLPPSEPV